MFAQAGGCHVGQAGDFRLGTGRELQPGVHRVIGAKRCHIGFGCEVLQVGDELSPSAVEIA